jgi:hypothetical protein
MVACDRERKTGQRINKSQTQAHALRNGETSGDKNGIDSTVFTQSWKEKESRNGSIGQTSQ